MQNYKSKFKIKISSKTFYFLFALLSFEFLFLNLSPASGQTMSNKDYIIKMQGFNTISGTTTNTDYSMRSIVGGLSPVVSEGVNFKIKAGFENTEPSLPFSVSLSSDLIDFGILSPTNPIVRTVTLSVYSLSTFGYSVIASEDHPLKMSPEASGANIADVTCDNGECNQETAAEWINSLTYGFGYRCDNVTGADCDSSFSKSNFYKHFANTSNLQLPQSVMSGIGSKNKDIQVSYKVNIAGTQGEGFYNNIITYIAIPNF